MSIGRFVVFVEGDSLEDARSKVRAELEGPWFVGIHDYYDIVDSKMGELKDFSKEKESEVIKNWDWKAEAIGYVKEGENLLSLGDGADVGLAGYKFHQAGELLMQGFSYNSKRFNIESGDYTFPETEEGWWYFTVEGHY